MTTRAVSISLKIPDNTAYTALVALRRLDVPVERVERSEIYFWDDDGDLEALMRRIEADERIFNPNKHRLSLLDVDRPGQGEVWIEALGFERPVVAWRLFDEHGRRASHRVLTAAAERLLCNPAIERAIFAISEDPAV